MVHRDEEEERINEMLVSRVDARERVRKGVEDAENDVGERRHLSWIT